MRGHLLMSEGERLRKVILEGVREGRVTLSAAALRLEVSYRQLRRIWKRFRDDGDPGLVHRGRGRPSNRSKPASLRQRAFRQPTLAEDLAGEAPLSSFGRACKKLGIAILTAHSPQAKGRVERKHGVFQDRFLKELALQGITSIAAANSLLQNGFVEGINRRFAVPPTDPVDAHRPLARGEELAAIFCREKNRIVGNDFTLRHEGRWYQISRNNRGLPKPRFRVTVRTLLDGTVELWLDGRRLDFVAIPTPKQDTAVPGTPPKPRPRPAIPRPGPDHPWRVPWSPKNPVAPI